MTESVSTPGAGETRVEAPVTNYWNSKKAPATKGDQVKGVLIRVDTGTFKDKPTSNYVIRAEDGNDIVLPNHTVLNGLVSKVPIGKGVRVVYCGQGEVTKRGRSPPELYEVYMFDPPVTPLQQPPAATTPQQTDDGMIKSIISELKESVTFFPGGIIPVSSITACAAKHLSKAGKQGTGGEVFETMKRMGLLIPKGDGYGVA